MAQINNFSSHFLSPLETGIYFVSSHIAASLPRYQTQSLWADVSILLGHHLPHHLILSLLLLLSSFSPLSVSSVTSSLLPLLSKAPVSAQSISPAVLITQLERAAYLPPSLLHRVLLLLLLILKLLVSPEGSLLLPQCTQSSQTTDTDCIHAHM